MKSIQKNLSSELEEIIRDYTNGDYMTVGALAQEIITVFKTKWLEMLPEPKKGDIFSHLVEIRKKEIDVNGIASADFGAGYNKALNDMRQQISKEE